MPARLEHLTSIEGLTAQLSNELLDKADEFLELTRKPIVKLADLRGKTIINVFYEASTRTRTSFELAGKRLGADVVNIAGDGMHEHPTQALLDALTIRRHRGKDFRGLTVAILGDVLHSRVARSNVKLLKMLGAQVRLAGPGTLLPRDAAALGCPAFDRIEPALEGADVVMMLRIQRERLGAALFPSLREYARVFGLNAARLTLAKPNALVMHPGPLNRGVEISEDIADGSHSVILDQVEAGVAVRMAVLAFAAKP